MQPVMDQKTRDRCEALFGADATAKIVFWLRTTDLSLYQSISVIVGCSVSEAQFRFEKGTAERDVYHLEEGRD